MIIVGIGAIITTSYLFTYKKNANSIEVFQAKVVSFQSDALDGPGIYKLNNGKTVQYSCGFCAYDFEGEVIGNPSVGDTVEVKVNRNYPGNDISDYYIYESGLYIKKL